MNTKVTVLSTPMPLRIWIFAGLPPPSPGMPHCIASAAQANVALPSGWKRSYHPACGPAAVCNATLGPVRLCAEMALMPQWPRHGQVDHRVRIPCATAYYYGDSRAVVVLRSPCSPPAVRPLSASPSGARFDARGEVSGGARV